MQGNKGTFRSQRTVVFCFFVRLSFPSCTCKKQIVLIKQMLGFVQIFLSFFFFLSESLKIGRFPSPPKTRLCRFNPLCAVAGAKACYGGCVVADMHLCSLLQEPLLVVSRALAIEEDAGRGGRGGGSLGVEEQWGGVVGVETQTLWDRWGEQPAVQGSGSTNGSEMGLKS